MSAITLPKEVFVPEDLTPEDPEGLFDKGRQAVLRLYNHHERLALQHPFIIRNEGKYEFEEMALDEGLIVHGDLWVEGMPDLYSITIHNPKPYAQRNEIVFFYLYLSGFAS